tara:strand:- start:244 stop:816 length:573 start_codon:yes stop_codon:yes gene_type:complete
MQEVKQEEIYYVWSSTERIGQIVQVDHNNIDPEWINFTDSTRINPSLIDEFLLPANTLQSANQISKDLGGLGSLVNTKESPVTPAVIKATPKAVAIAAPPVEEVNVMMEMLKKMSKKNKAEMPVLINIPSNSVYEMLKEQMDLEEADLNEQIGLLVENQINNLQEQLREQITIFITKYYTNVTTREKNPK